MVFSEVGGELGKVESMKKRGYKSLKLRDNIELIIWNFIDYDNKHHCFRRFSLGFCLATIVIQIIILTVIINKL